MTSRPFRHIIYRSVLQFDIRRIIVDIISSVMESYGLSPLPEYTAEAMAYVPFQQFNSETYSPAQALEAGTVYPILNKPFFGSKCEVKAE